MENARKQNPAHGWNRERAQNTERETRPMPLHSVDCRFSAGERQETP